MTNKWRIDWQTGNAYLWDASMNAYVFFCKFDVESYESEVIETLEERLEYSA